MEAGDGAEVAVTESADGVRFGELINVCEGIDALVGER